MKVLTQGRSVSLPNFRPRERHGMRWTPEYEIWTALKKRCHNPKDKDFQDYGGRGIHVCLEWRESFLAFITSVGRRPRKGLWLDRIDNAKGYEPGNVQWTTICHQQRNKRSNHWVTVYGERLSLIDAVEKYAIRGVSYFTVRSRRNYGWDIMRALTQPLRRKS